MVESGVSTKGNEMIDVRKSNTTHTLGSSISQLAVNQAIAGRETEPSVEHDEGKEEDSVGARYQDMSSSNIDEPKAVPDAQPSSISGSMNLTVPRVGSGIHQRSNSTLISQSTAAIVAQVAAQASTNKKKKLTKQEESALKKRKAKYDQIQKQMKKKQELDAAAFEQAKKERERKKLEDEERKKQEMLAEERRQA